jgi:hypothetical protein
MESTNSMKKFVILAIVLCATSLVAAAAGIDGKWTSEMKRGDNTIQQTLTLKADGGALTGTVEMSFNGQGRSVDIKNGKVDGNKFSFSMVQRGKQGEMTVIWEGTVDGDEIHGTRKREGGEQGQPFTAKRQQ